MCWYVAWALASKRKRPPTTTKPTRLPLRRANMPEATLRKPGLMAAAVAAILAGCAVGPNYKRPDTLVAPNYAGAETSTYSTDGHIQAKFWTEFDDETLNQLVDDALLANHDLRIALG